MDAGVEVKVESEDEVETYDGTYACVLLQGRGDVGGGRSRKGKEPAGADGWAV